MLGLKGHNVLSMVLGLGYHPQSKVQKCEQIPTWISATIGQEECYISMVYEINVITAKLDLHGFCRMSKQACSRMFS
jgi:hypothetical protein